MGLKFNLKIHLHFINDHTHSLKVIFLQYLLVVLYMKESFLHHSQT